MIRRSFLGSLAALALAPFVKVPTVPPVKKGVRHVGITDADIIAAELERVREHIPLLFERDDLFFNRIGQHVGGRRRRQGSRVHSVVRG